MASTSPGVSLRNFPFFSEKFRFCECVKMSKVEEVRALVKQRLTAAAEDIFGLFERTIAEYEETLCRSKEENERQRRLLDAVFNPQLRLHRADVQQLSGSKDEVLPEQKERSPSPDQEDPEPQHIKEEQGEVWTSQEGEQLQGLEEAHIIKFTFTPVPVKSEDDDEEKSQTSQLHQRQTELMETGADGEDCGGPEPDRNSHPGTLLTPDTEEKTGDSSEPERDHRDSDCKDPDGKSFRCSVCSKSFKEKGVLKRHERIHTGVKPFSCTFCSKTFTQKTGLDCHLQTHTEERPFSCPVCSKTFGQKAYLQKHLRYHTGEKPYSCSLCSKCFSRCDHLQAHMRTHTGEKPYSCSLCSKSFSRGDHLQAHMKVHTGEKPYSCSFCEKCFSCNADLQSHTRIHTGEKPFRCTICDRKFTWRCQLKRHKCGGESSQLRELWTNQEGEQIEGLEEADIILTHVPVNSEGDDDEEKPPFSQLHQRQTEQMETEADAEDCGGPEPDRNSHPDGLESRGLMYNTFTGHMMM